MCMWNFKNVIQYKKCFIPARTCRWCCRGGPPARRSCPPSPSPSRWQLLHAAIAANDPVGGMAEVGLITNGMSYGGTTMVLPQPIRASPRSWVYRWISHASNAQVASWATARPPDSFPPTFLLFLSFFSHFHFFSRRDRLLCRTPWHHRGAGWSTSVASEPTWPCGAADWGDTLAMP